MELEFRSIAQASAAMRAKRVSPVEITEMFLDRAEDIQTKINPFAAILGMADVHIECLYVGICDADITDYIFSGLFEHASQNISPVFK